MAANVGGAMHDRQLAWGHWHSPSQLTTKLGYPGWCVRDQVCLATHHAYLLVVKPLYMGAGAGVCCAQSTPAVNAWQAGHAHASATQTQGRKTGY